MTSTLSSTTSPNTFQTRLRIGTRASALAIAQVELFVKLLKDTTPDLQTSVHPSTSAPGDTDKSTPLHTLASGGKAIWTADLETSLLANEIDCIVHSLKDVPTRLPSGCVILVVGDREEKRDCLVVNARRYTWPGREDNDDDGGDGEGRDEEAMEDQKRIEKKMIKSLADLPAGAIVGTSSVRRTAMLRRHHPHLRTKDIRGNLGTRLRKLDTLASEDSASALTSASTSASPAPAPSEYDAILLATAGLTRLGLSHRIVCLLPPSSHIPLPSITTTPTTTPNTTTSTLLPAVGQGALGVEIRTTDLHHRFIGLPIRKCVIPSVAWPALAERAMLRVLEGGCSVPVGVDTTFYDEDNNDIYEGGEKRGERAEKRQLLRIKAAVVSLDGSDSVEGEMVRPVKSEEEADQVGEEMARELIERGAGRILREISMQKGESV